MKKKNVLNILIHNWRVLPESFQKVQKRPQKYIFTKNQSGYQKTHNFLQSIKMLGKVKKIFSKKT